MSKRPLGLTLNLDEINDKYQYNKSLEKKVKTVTISDLINERIGLDPVKKLANNINNTLTSSQRDKNEFTNIIDNSKPLGVHSNRKFDIDEPNNPKYNSYVYVNEKNNEIIKVYNYECEASADFMIIKELAYQSYAYSLMTECNFKVPLIKKYDKILLDPSLKRKYQFSYPCLFYFVMEKINYVSLYRALEEYGIMNEETEICKKLSERLTGLNNCLSGKGLKHNDYHAENILVHLPPSGNSNADDENIKIALIDYGNSDEETSLKSWEYTCEKLVKIKQRISSSPSKKSLSSAGGGNKSKTRRRMPNIKNDLVIIKKSKIEGLGVFAAQDIKSGTKIADYYGKDMKWKTFKRKYGEYKSNSLHTYPMRRIWRILVAKEEPYLSKNLTNYINEIPGKANCELKKRALYAKNNIKKGDELLLDYPKDYNRFWLADKS